MSARKILAILVALSVLFAPGVGAAAMASPHHDMSMSMAGHCQAPPATSGDHDKAAGKNCCIAMCMAVAVAAPGSPSEVREPSRQIPQFATPAVYTNNPHEIATPPPRHG
ncbi:MAG TPA: hypothetical protein VIK68_10920 [Sphingomicrobium sp.]